MGLFSAQLNDLKQYLLSGFNFSCNNVILLQHNCFNIIAGALKRFIELAKFISRHNSNICLEYAQYLACYFASFLYKNESKFQVLMTNGRFILLQITI